MNGNPSVSLKNKIMNEKTLLISIDKLKANSVIPVNTDEHILSIALNEVHELELEPLVGKEYLTKLTTAIDTDTLNVDDHTVITDVIQPFLIYGTLYYSIPYLVNKVNNKGVNVSTDATLSTNNDKGLTNFHGLIHQKWDSYKRRLIDYFKTDNNAETNINKNEDTTGGSLGMWIPDKEDSNRYAYRARASKTNIWRG